MLILVFKKDTTFYIKSYNVLINKYIDFAGNKCQ